MEKLVHSAFAELAQNIADKHGIKVNSVSFDWLDVSPQSEGKLIVLGTSTETSTSAALSNQIGARGYEFAN